MKKIILLLSLLTGISASALAQVSFGAKAGASFTTNTESGTTNVMNSFFKAASSFPFNPGSTNPGSGVYITTNIIGFHGGLFVNLPISAAFSIQPEVLYSMKGSQTDKDGDAKIRLNYIDIPVMLQYNTHRLFFEAGPQLGILTSGKFVAGSLNLDAKELFKTVDFGYATGLGYKLKSGPILGLRYNGGITNTYKDNDNKDKARNSALQLYAAFIFGRK
ncbi:PorT family protein [Hymenobacter sp. BT664]|uniref:PorT family protein n=1 Tax=Hymenobacter montanus TaxID=2771359 RepID=A0A927BDC3_9BACT|nr:porin family protein [Hymenobacter montanus]MBD2767972.1 PorT family protein [Hymenobacter montanus]